MSNSTTQQKPLVLIDASSAILLYKAEFFDFVTEWFRVVMAESVYREIIHTGYPGESYFRSCLENNKFILIDPCFRPDIETGNRIDDSGLDLGERDTLLLYANCLARFIIIDDGKAAKFCLKNNVPFINALLVPKVLWFSGCINAHLHKTFFDRLKNLGRYSPTVIDFATDCQSDNLSFFLSNK